MGLTKWIFFVVFPATVAIYVFFLLPGKVDVKPPKMADRWWGKGEKTKESKAVNKYTLITDEVTRIELRVKTHGARLIESFDGTNFEYGLRTDFLRGVLYYWKETYRWDEYQNKINAMNQFKTRIEGLDVHFTRSIPTDYPGKKRAIVLIHGWPSSFWDFYKVIPLLMDGKTEEDVAFEVICPSIPGYAFSEAPHKPGFDASDAARVFYKLMRRLGHQNFYVHGTDWGSSIATIMGQAYPKSVLGVHVTFSPPPVKSSTVTVIAKLALGEVWPSYVYSSEELASRIPMGEYLMNLIKESGYFHIQATKPDTIGHALTDSAAGLASYILEKFSVWSDIANTKCADGCIREHYSLDEVLTNVMIYWLSNSITSSMRFYKENLASIEVDQWNSQPLLVPSGLAVFPKEPLQQVRSLTALKFRNIVHYSHMARGGHFPALEVPDLLADDIKKFIQTVEKL